MLASLLRSDHCYNCSLNVEGGIVGSIFVQNARQPSASVEPAEQRQPEKDATNVPLQNTAKCHRRACSTSWSSDYLGTASKFLRPRCLRATPNLQYPHLTLPHPSISRAASIRRRVHLALQTLHARRVRVIRQRARTRHGGQIHPRTIHTPQAAKSAAGSRRSACRSAGRRGAA